MTVKKLRSILRPFGVPLYSFKGTRLCKADLVYLVDRLDKLTGTFRLYWRSGKLVVATVKSRPIGSQIDESRPIENGNNCFQKYKPYRPIVDRSIAGAYVERKSKPVDVESEIIRELGRMSATHDQARCMNRILNGTATAYDKDRENERKLKAVESIRNRYDERSSEWKQWNDVFQASI